MDFDPVQAAESILKENSMALVVTKKNVTKQQESRPMLRRNMLGIVLYIDRENSLVSLKNSLTGKRMQHRATEAALDAMLRGVRSDAVHQIALEDDLIVGFTA